jgi:hypothetical protein
MNRLADQDPILVELYSAIAHFYGQQQLVIRAILDLGIIPSSLRGVSNWQTKVEQRGLWGKDWEYFFHGGGCQIIHLITGEPINWEGPDPAAFSIPSFTQHLEWRIEQGAPLPMLVAYMQTHGSTAIRPLVDRLITQGIISADRHLLPPAVQATAA